MFEKLCESCGRTHTESTGCPNCAGLGEVNIRCTCTQHRLDCGLRQEVYSSFNPNCQVHGILKKPKPKVNKKQFPAVEKVVF